MSSTAEPSQDIMDVISPILDEYTKWYGAALGTIFQKDAPSIANPAGSVLENFLTTLSADHFITNKRAHGLLSLQKSMLQSYQEIAAKQGKEITLFTNRYEEFYTALRHLEKDCVLENNGLDYLTGLNSKSVLVSDIEKELERLSRNGSSFGLALIQIDRYDDIMAQINDGSSLKYTRKIAALIKKSIRSFDEAYRSGPGEFVVILKQADIAGGLSALTRMGRDVNEQDIKVSLNTEDITLSLSCCVAEPVEHDIAEDLIKNLRSDLEKGKGRDDGHGQILEYHEISPLQRYMQEEKGS